MKQIIIIVLSQVAWFAAVLGAAQGNGWIGPLAALLTVALAGIWAPRGRDVWRLAAVAVLIGYALETLMLASGLVSYVLPGPIAALPPPWLLSLWLVFSVLPTTAFAWLQGRLALQVLLAGLGAPLAYGAGARLGAMTFSEPTYAGLLLIAILWAIAFPLLMAASARISGS